MPYAIASALNGRCCIQNPLQASSKTNIRVEQSEESWCQIDQHQAGQAPHATCCCMDRGARTESPATEESSGPLLSSTSGQFGLSLA